MATTLAYIASLCTRKYTSSANAKNDVACQEFYDSSYNYVGIISFPGLNLENKVITEIWLDIDAEKAGYGVKNTKTVYLRKANYQDDIASGVTGGQYVGDESLATIPRILHTICEAIYKASTPASGVET